MENKMKTKESERIGRDIFNDIRDERKIDLERIMNTAQKNGIEISQDLIEGIRNYNNVLLPQIKELKKEVYDMRSKAMSVLGVAKETYSDHPDVRTGMVLPL